MSAARVQYELDPKGGEGSRLDLSNVHLPVTIYPAMPLADEDLLEFCASNKGFRIESGADGGITIMTPAEPETSREPAACRLSDAMGS